MQNPKILNNHQIVALTWKQENSLYEPVILTRFQNKMFEHNLQNLKLSYTLSDSKKCIGFKVKGEYLSCPQNTTVTDKFERCASCEDKLGFKSAFIFQNEPNEAISKYLSQKHFVYLAGFYPNIFKIGTASNKRKFIRLIEQDALIFKYIGQAKTGFNIQDYEKKIAKLLNARLSVSFKQKVKNLTNHIELSTFEIFITSALKQLSGSDIYNTEFTQISEGKIETLDTFTKVYYPTNYDYIKDPKFILGKFKGLRGKALILENNKKEIVLDARALVGHTVTWSDEDLKYIEKQKLEGKEEQLGLLL